jgi:hypothetical protein
MTARRPAYALIYLLAALPLLVVAGNITVRTLAGALRVQRVAAVETANDTARRGLVDTLRDDARTASAIDVTPSESATTLSFTGPRGTAEYRFAKARVERVATVPEQVDVQMRWPMPDVTCTPRIEVSAADRNVLWLRFEYALEVRRGLYTRRHYAIALPVGTGGAS